MTRLTFRQRIARYGIPDASGHALSWLLSETSVLRRFRDDLPADAREGNVPCEGYDPREAVCAASRPGEQDPKSEEANVRALWDACLSATRRAAHVQSGKDSASSANARR
jgi:hypothetical protein